VRSEAFGWHKMILTVRIRPGAETDRASVYSIRVIELGLPKAARRAILYNIVLGCVLYTSRLTVTGIGLILTV
jgi:hypothetical protein